jgi:hypothetical protein
MEVPERRVNGLQMSQENPSPQSEQRENVPKKVRRILWVCGMTGQSKAITLRGFSTQTDAILRSISILEQVHWVCFIWPGTTILSSPFQGLSFIPQRHRVYMVVRFLHLTQSGKTSILISLWK